MKQRIGVMEYGSMGVENICTFNTPLLPYSTTPLPPPRLRRGFTLLEVMIAVVILAIAMTVAFQTFSAVTRAWTGARTLMDKMHHGDFVLGQLTTSLRSMFMVDVKAEGKLKPEIYAFRIKNNSAGEGEHTISWVTASSAFIPPGEEAYSHGLHRIEVGGGTDEDGVDGLVVTVWPYLADEEKVEKKSWFVSENIKGLRCKVYDTKEGEEGWKDTWEYSNAIPGLIEITLYAEPEKEYGDPVEFRQIIEIPLGPPVTNDVSEAK